MYKISSLVAGLSLFFTSFVFCQPILLPAQEGNLVGFRKNNVFEINPKFEQARRFVNGLAAVKLNGKWGFIDSLGKVIIPCQYLDVSEFREGFAKVTNDQGIVNYINIQGNGIAKGNLFEGRDFSDGLVAVRQVQGWFYLNSAGDQAIQKMYFQAGDFGDSLGVVYTAPNEAVFIDKGGNIKIHDSFISAQKFSEGLACVQKKVNNRIVSFFINKKGKKVFNRTFENAMYFSEHLAPAKSSANHLWGYIGLEGSWKIPPVFAKAGEFQNGIAEIKDNSLGFATFIDKKGHFLLRKKNIPEREFGSLPQIPISISTTPAAAEIYFIPSTLFLTNPGILHANDVNFYKANQKTPLVDFYLPQVSFQIWTVWPDKSSKLTFYKVSKNQPRITITK